LNWVWLRRSKQSQPLNLKTNVPINQRVETDKRIWPTKSDRLGLPDDPQEVAVIQAARRRIVVISSRRQPDFGLTRSHRRAFVRRFAVTAPVPDRLRLAASMRARLPIVRSCPSDRRGRQQHRDHRKSGKQSSGRVGVTTVHGGQFQELSKDSH
jgi:hypothetical protein